MLLLFTTLISYVPTAVLSLYASDSPVIELTDANFDSKVMDSNCVWVVEFYAPWCGHCQSFAPEYIKAASALKGVAKVGAVNVDEYKALARTYSISSFPTIKIFDIKKNPIAYSGGRSARSIADAVLKTLEAKVNAALGGPKQSSSNEVIELTDDNFDKLVLNSDDIWLVEFYAPWCGHCKNLAPHWIDAANQLKGKAKLGTLDATVHHRKTAEYGIQGYPTIKYFKPHTRSYLDAVPYEAGRVAPEIVSWVLEEIKANVPAPKVEQITSQSVFGEACGNHALCVIAVLPHILDCQSECRNGYLKTLATVSNDFKQNGWGWIWSEAGSQPHLEFALEIGGFGYPAMALLNQKKMKYSILKGSFSSDGITEFLRDVSFGRGTTAPLAKLPVIETVEEWNGKDGELPQEEDLDLSDVDLDDKNEL